MYNRDFTIWSPWTPDQSLLYDHLESRSQCVSRPHFWHCLSKQSIPPSRWILSSDHQFHFHSREDDFSVRLDRGGPGTGWLTAQPIPNIIGFLLSDQDLEAQCWSQSGDQASSTADILDLLLPAPTRLTLGFAPRLLDFVVMMADTGTTSAFLILLVAGGRWNQVWFSIWWSWEVNWHRLDFHFYAHCLIVSCNLFKWILWWW